MTGSIGITRGLPGAGKTTVALEAVSTIMAQGRPAARVNRDDLRAELYPSDVAAGKGVLDRDKEEHVTRVQHARVRALAEAGVNVIVDDTNLRLRFARAWATMAHNLRVPFYVWTVDTPLEECIERDRARGAAGGRRVGENVIRDMARKFAGWPAQEILPAEERPDPVFPPYVPDTTLPMAWIVDIDGTIAAKRTGEGERGWHDYDRVGEDEPVQTIMGVAEALREQTGADLLVMSGRQGTPECRKATVDWLDKHEFAYEQLFMRTAGDMRKDSIVKNEIFETHIAHRWHVLGALDDRNQVVAMWRAKGLTCLQVKEGAY